jgi:hypothetical protein
VKRIILVVLLGAALCAGAFAGDRAKAGQGYLGLNTLSGVFLGDVPIGFQPNGIEFGSYTDNSGSKDNFANITLNLDGGWFLFDGFGVGLNVLGWYMRDESGSGSWNQTIMIAPGLEVMYVMDFGWPVAPYVKLSANWLYFTGNSKSSPTFSTPYTGILVMPTAGVKWYVAGPVSVDAAVFYHYTRASKDSSWYTVSSFGLLAGVSITL